MRDFFQIPAKGIYGCYHQYIILASARLEVLDVSKNQCFGAAGGCDLRNGKSLGSGNVSDNRLGVDVFSSQVDEIKQDLHVRVGEAKGWPQSRPHRSGKITFAVPSPLVTIFS